MADDPILNETVPDKKTATKLAKTLGCEGAHQMGDGWHPCESHEALLALINGGAAGYRSYKERGKKTAKRTILIDHETVQRTVKRRTIVDTKAQRTV